VRSGVETRKGRTAAAMVMAREAMLMGSTGILKGVSRWFRMKVSQSRKRFVLKPREG
jgi:hypothetical protein